MDDNKMLTLVSNERIPLSPSMRMMFEISNLDNATPATVSRAGILFINAKDIGSKPFLDSWIERRDNDKEKSSLSGALQQVLHARVPARDDHRLRAHHPRDGGHYHAHAVLPAGGAAGEAGRAEEGAR